MDFEQRTQTSYYPKGILIQWLKILLYFQIAGLVLSLIDYIPINTNWCRWLQQLFNIGSIVAMFHLAAVGKRYRKAAIFSTAQLACQLVNSGISYAVIMMNAIRPSAAADLQLWNLIGDGMGLAVLILNVLYLYQYFNAHGDLVQEMDGTLAQKWRNLFIAGIVVSVLTTAASFVLSIIMVATGIDGNIGVDILYILVNLPIRIITVVTILYLNRTIQIIQNQEE